MARVHLRPAVSSSLRALVALAVLAVAGSSAAKGPKGNEAPGFDRAAAVSALGVVDLAKCKAPNAKRGEGHVTVTFNPDGAAAGAVVDKGPMAGTPVAKCIQGQYARVKVPAFKGDAVAVGKTFRFE